tara:strand:- start:13382 stop:13573 length:192 start_codon:yes stop_codon:yes gene_type:complete
MEWLSQHLAEWSLVWFGFLFWGSIFGATLFYFFEANIVISLIGYTSGLLFGLVAKYKGWSWIS